MQSLVKAIHPEEVKTVAVVGTEHKPETVSVTSTEYNFFGALMLMGACVLGWFIRGYFKSLINSNTDLKNAIEKLANVAQTIHIDLIEFKVEVAATYVTKEDLSQLKQDLASTCALRHNRRDTDQK